MLVAALFPIAAARFGMSAVLNGFALVCVLAWVLVATSVPETKGVSLEDIHSSLGRSASNAPPPADDKRS